MTEEQKQHDELMLEAWVYGDLEYQLKDCQREMRSKITSWDGFKYFIKCSRRLGKTHMLCAMAVEQCLRKPKAKVRYGASTKDALEEMVLPVMETVLEDCPAFLKPEWIASKKVYVFKNGSRIRLAGIDLHPDRLRGTSCDLFIIDEAGFVSDLEYFIHSVAMPQFLDPKKNIVKGRKLVVSSSPAMTPAHEFTQMCEVAKLEGNYSWFDIYAGGYPEDVIDVFAKECGGKHTSTFKREYLALDVVDEERAIIPEWKIEYEQAPPIDEYFKFYLKHDALDTGVRDKTACLFSYYDFRRAKLFVMDEFTVSGPEMTTEVVAKGIRAKEKENYGNLPIYRRVSDVDLLLIQDLTLLHNLPFTQTDKGTIQEMVNLVRIWVSHGRVVVDPKCVQLTGCLRYGIWNDKKTEFERSKAYGHFDALAALVYLIRNLDHTTNPVPIHYGKNPEDVILRTPETKTKVETFKKAFNLERTVTNGQQTLKKGFGYY